MKKRLRNNAVPTLTVWLCRAWEGGGALRSGARALPALLVASGVLAPLQTSLATTDSQIEAKIVWRSDRSGSQSIWLMDWDGGDKTQLTDDEGNDNCPAVSPDGRFIALASDRGHAGHFTLWLMNHDGSDLHEIADVPGLNAQFPSWHPDGEHLIFNAVIGATEGGIWRVDPSGTGLTPLHSGYCGRPFYSPDGAEILFDKRTSPISYSHQLFRMDADGSNVQQCTFGDPPSEATTTFCGGYSPDGSLITYSRGHGIWIADATCPVSGATELFHGSYPSNVWYMPTFSPDGEWLVFSHRPPGDDENIYISRIDGSELRQLTYDPGADDVPRWGVAYGDPACLADINGDGIVDVQDLLLLLAAWGPCQ